VTREKRRINWTWASTAAPTPRQAFFGEKRFLEKVSAKRLRAALLSPHKSLALLLSEEKKDVRGYREKIPEIVYMIRQKDLQVR